MSRRPFYGQTPAPPIARMDMQSATAPGRMFATAMNNLGIAVGGAIAKHAENKEKKENQQFAENAFMSLGMNSEEAKAASRDPQVGQVITQFKQMSQQQEAHEDEMGLATKQHNFGVQKYNDAESEKDELEAELDQRNRFMLTPGEEIDPEGPSRHSVLKNLRGGKGVTPPARMIKTDSLSVEGLPESFKDFGRKVEQAVQQGEISPRVGASMIAEKQELAQAQATRDADFNDKVEFELFKHELEKGEAKQADLSGSLVVNDTIDRSFDLISPFSTGFGSYLKSIPSTEALALDKSLETIKANIGFDKLQAMREASPTGGALGQVSNQELSSLQSVFGNLDQAQDDDDLKYNLGLLRHVYNNVVHGVGNHPYLHPNDSNYQQIYATPTSGINPNYVPNPNKEASPEMIQYMAELEEQERKRALGYQSEMGNLEPKPDVPLPPIPKEPERDDLIRGGYNPAMLQ